MTGAGQLSLAFEQPSPDYGRDAFIVVDANHQALQILDAWSRSAEAAIVVAGPEGAGKTHLLSILEAAPLDRFGVAPPSTRFRLCARTGEALDALQENLLRLPDGALVLIDNLERCASPAAILAAWEIAHSRRHRLALAGRGRPEDWAGTLVDLKTRLEAASRAVLPDPDEQLMAAVIAKLFADRQMRVGPELCAYASARLPRTFAAARGFVEAADKRCAGLVAPLTKPLARSVISDLSAAAARS